MSIQKFFLSVAVITGIVLLSAGLTRGAPHAEVDARASLRLQENGALKTDQCRVSMKRCMIETTANQPKCLASVAELDVCTGRLIAAAIRRRATLEAKTSGELSLRRCLDNVDAAVGAWLMANDSTHSASAIDSLTGEQNIESAIARCELILK